MADTPDDNAPLPRELRFLKALVTVLTAVMILGVITIVALLVIRLNDRAPVLVTPEVYAIPAGVEITGFSLTPDHVVIVSDDGMIRVFEIETRNLVQELPVSPSQ